MDNFTYEQEKNSSFIFWVILIILLLFYIVGWLTRDVTVADRVGNIQIGIGGGPFVEEQVIPQTPPNLVIPIPEDDFNEANSSSDSLKTDLKAIPKKAI